MIPAAMRMVAVTTANGRRNYVVVICGQTLIGRNVVANVYSERTINVIQRQGSVVTKALIQAAISGYIVSVGSNVYERIRSPSWIFIMNAMTSRLSIFFYFYAAAMICLWGADSLFTDMHDRYEYAKVLPISLGTGFGIALTAYVSFLIMENIRSKNNLKFSSAPIITAYVLTVLVLPFAFMAGVVGGGTLGGGLLGALFEWLNLNTRIGIPIGIGLGIFFVSLLVTLPVLFFGYFFGKGISKLIRT